MKTPNYDIVAHCVAAIAKEYELDDRSTQILARIVKATVDTYKPNSNDLL